LSKVDLDFYDEVEIVPLDETHAEVQQLRVARERSMGCRATSTTERCVPTRSRSQRDGPTKGSV